METNLKLDGLDAFMSIEDIAKVLQRGTKTARNFVKTYNIPKIFITKRTILYRKQDVFNTIQEIGGFTKE